MPPDGSQRFVARLPLPRALGLLMLPMAVVQGVFFVLAPLDAPWRAAGLALSGLACLLAGWLVWRPSKLAAWLLLAGLAGSASLYFTGQYRIHVGRALLAVESLTLLGYLAPAVLIALRGLGISAARAWLLVVSLLIPIGAWSCLRIVPLAAAPPRWPYWRYESGSAQLDRLRGYVVSPGALARTYYPDNPRGYFEDASTDPLAQRRLGPLQFRSLREGAGRLVPAGEGSRVQRVELEQKFVDEPWLVHLALHEVPLEPGREHVLTFRGRADQEREIVWTIYRALPTHRDVVPWRSVPLDDQWRTFSAHFSVPSDPGTCELVFNLAGDLPPVEIDDVRLEAVAGQSLAVPQVTPFSVAYRFNQAGFRGNDYPVERPADTFRIVVLGDSVTFGQGVHQADTFSSRLEQSLNAAPAGGLENRRRFEVINCGLCGYSTREERASFESVAHRFDPQLVLLVMFSNDYLDSGQQSDRQLDRLVGLEQAEEALASVTGRRFEACLSEVRALEASCRKQGARLAVVLFRYSRFDDLWRQLHDAVATELADGSIPWIDLGDPILERFRPEHCSVHTFDGHPNERVHRLAARLIEQFLRERSLLPSDEPSAAGS